jgi:hypothetical protein
MPLPETSPARGFAAGIPEIIKKTAWCEIFFVILCEERWFGH